MALQIVIQCQRGINGGFLSKKDGDPSVKIMRFRDRQRRDDEKDVIGFFAPASYAA